MSDSTASPAEAAALDAERQLFECLDIGQSFIFEAGAGAGKTYSLVVALQYLLGKKEASLRRNGQRIACITYTNVASDEIHARTEHNPLVFSSTIHSFCWTLIKDFQRQLREHLPGVGKWSERIESAGGIKELPILYDLGYPSLSHGKVMLGHSDIIPLTVKMLENDKFRRLLSAKYPYLFIDEYQDTSKALIESLKLNFLDMGSGPVLGFFGDEWQKIYPDGSGGIVHQALKQIEKGANFRSAPEVVEFLNAIRPELMQAVSKPSETGSVSFYHCNSWAGERRSDSAFSGDLPPEAINRSLKLLKERLAEEGWEFKDGEFKTLMLTHKSLAAEQGYPHIVEAFSNTDEWASKDNLLIKFCCDELEPACEAFAMKKYGDMFKILGIKAPRITNGTEKLPWFDSMTELLRLRKEGTIGEVLTHLAQTRKPLLPQAVSESWEYLIEAGDGKGEHEHRSVAVLRSLRDVSYAEMEEVCRFIRKETPFATQHGVKGAEFNEVIVIAGKGWNHYDFDGMLGWWPDLAPSNKRPIYERSRNIFYVACSRPKKRLAILFTSEISQKALSTIEGWIGTARIIDISTL